MENEKYFKIFQNVRTIFIIVFFTVLTVHLIVQDIIAAKALEYPTTNITNNILPRRKFMEQIMNENNISLN